MEYNTLGWLAIFLQVIYLDTFRNFIFCGLAIMFFILARSNGEYNSKKKRKAGVSKK